MKASRTAWWLCAALLLLVGMRAVAALAGAPAYHVVELGAGSPIDVNSAGTVVGIDGTSAGPQPWIIVNGKRTYLPLPTDPVKQTYAMVTRVSESGVVVGHVSAKPLMWKPDASGVYKAEWIPLPQGVSGGLPTGVRDTPAGPQVLLNVGYPSFLTSPTVVYFSSTEPYLYDATEGLVDLVVRYRLAYPVYVSDMTASGRILASDGMILEPNWAVTPAPPARTLSWTGFSATRLNEKGEFVVTASLATSDGHGEIARYSPGKGWFVIETYIGAMYPYSADGISEAGDALSSQYAGHMLTTADGQRLSLNGLLLEPGYALTSAPGGAMSDSGRIVSVARNPAGIWNVVRLDPATSSYPPPAPVVLTGIAHPATTTAPWTAISLTWTASPTATAYIVERKGPTDAAFVALTPASGTIQTKYDDTAIAALTSYTYRVLPIGLGGTGAPSNEVTVLSPPPMDTVPPVARITAPANGAVVSGPVTVSATASDNVGLRGFEILYAPNQGSETLCGKAYTDVKLSDTLSCTWDPRYLPSGTTATLTAYAYDALGNYVMSPISVTYKAVAADTTSPLPVADTAAPKVTISEPANNATVSGTVTVRASAQDNVGVVRMEILDSSTRVLASATTSTITYLWNTSGLSKRQTLTVRAYDAAGNLGTAKVTVRIGR